MNNIKLFYQGDEQTGFISYRDAVNVPILNKWYNKTKEESATCAIPYVLNPNIKRIWYCETGVTSFSEEE